MWAHKTTRKEATDEIPFSLAFGTEVMVFMEIGMPSYKVNYYDPKINEDMVKLNLDLLEKIGMLHAS